MARGGLGLSDVGGASTEGLRESRQAGFRISRTPGWALWSLSMQVPCPQGTTIFLGGAPEWRGMAYAEF